MENDNICYEREIDLRELVIAILRKWRMILAATVAFSLLLGTYKASACFLEGKDFLDTDLQEKYDKEIKLYRQRISACEREIANLTEIIAAQQEYLEESVFMNMSPYDIWEARTEFFVETDYRIMPKMVYQDTDFTSTVLQSYVSALVNAQFMEQTAEILGIQSRYLKELVNVAIGREDNGYNHLLILTVRHPEKEGAKAVMEMLLEELERSGEHIRSTVRDHTITKVSASLGAVVDMEAQKQRGERGQLESLIDSLSQKQEEVEKLKQERPPRRADTLEVSVVKTGVKYGMTGGLLGAIVVIFFICAAFIMSDKLFSYRELKSRFSVRILGLLPIVIEETHSNSPINTWLNRLENRKTVEDAERVYDLISVNLINTMGSDGGAGPVFLAGGAPKDQIETLAKHLQKRIKDVQIMSGGNFLSNPDSLKKLAECNTVVLVEQCMVSTYSEVEQELEKVSDLHKMLAGCVLFQ